jgi:hypothetical protein
MHEYSNAEARCCGKATSITYSECVFIVLSIHNAMHMRHIVISGLPDSTYFSCYLTNSTFSKKKKKVFDHEMSI